MSTATISNNVHLCTYVDRLGQDAVGLKKLLNKEFAGLFGGVHLLPFYSPIDGLDAGFDPIDHTMVDPRLGTWKDIENIAEDYDLMVDMIVNHISASSPEFLSFLESGEQSLFYDLFLTFESVFPNGATEADLTEIYRPRPGLPFTPFKLADGSVKLVWTTFTSNQIDIDVNSDAGREYLNRIVATFSRSNIKLLRLDAVGYAVKSKGTDCFLTSNTFAFIKELRTEIAKYGMKVLVEIHSHYATQIGISRHSDYVYDFALPPLVLHALYRRTSLYLQRWLNISPRNCITVLDTHDGIGIIDVARDGKEDGILEDAEIDFLVEEIHLRSEGQSRKATGSAASNVDLYQVNCTIYSALGEDDHLYLLARLIQFFCPGIPQVYYVGLLAGSNDMGLLSKTNVGRDINRHYYSKEEISKRRQVEVVKHLFSLIEFRNKCSVFNGDFSIVDTSTDNLLIRWVEGKLLVSLFIDLENLNFEVTIDDKGNKQVVDSWAGFSDLDFLAQPADSKSKGILGVLG